MAETEPTTNECVASAELNAESECNSVKECTTTEVSRENGCHGDAPKEVTETPAVDTTEDEAQTGTKRKSEDILTTEEACDETKKQKVEDAPTTTEAEPTPAVEVKENGTSAHTEEETTVSNGKEEDTPLPDEIVTKTVEDVKKLCEDPVEASS